MRVPSARLRASFDALCARTLEWPRWPLASLASAAGAGTHRELRYSFDMLGEGARTAADAGRYFTSYARAIDAIGARAGNAALPSRPGISVKLSALHPRFEAISRQR